MRKLDLRVEDLLLDLHNPRIGPVDTQSAALSSIIQLNPRHFLTMMESIKEHGLDPGDSLYIIPEEAGLDQIVVDGNRRLAALKVLHNPALLRGTAVPEATSKKLVECASSFDGHPDTLSCVEFDTRMAANEWIERRHGRGLNGEERIAWGPLEIQRFQKDNTVLDIIEFVERNAHVSEAEWQELRKGVEKSPTTLQRLLDSSAFRKWLGLSIVEEDGERVPYLATEAGGAAQALVKVFDDIAEGRANSRSLNNKDAIQEYIENIPGELKPNARPNKELRRARDLTIESTGQRSKKAETENATASSIRAKTTRARPPRSTLAPVRHNFAQPKDSKGERLLYEASKIKVANFPLASAYLLRAFLEHAINDYMTANRLPRVEMKGKKEHTLTLGERAERVMEHMVSQGVATRADLRVVKTTLTNANDATSIAALNDYHHNKYHQPVPDALRAAWDGSEPLFIAVFGAA